MTCETNKKKKKYLSLAVYLLDNQGKMLETKLN